MADQLEKIVIDVDFNLGNAQTELSSVNASLQNLKKYQKELKEKIAEGNDEWGKNSAELSKVNQQIKLLTASQKALSGQLQTTEKTNDALGDSFRELDAQLRALENQYKSLTAAQRKSKEGQELRDAIIKQKEALKQFDAELGNHQRNVGNYENALKNVGVGLGGLQQKMKAFFANPWLLIIGAIVKVLKELIDAFRGSEERMNELKNAFAPLQGAVTLIKQAFDALARVVGDVLVKALDKALQGVQWIARQIDRLARKAGLNWGLEEMFNEAAATMQALTEAEIAYANHRRKWIKEQATLENQIAKLKNEVAQKDIYTSEERLKKLEQVNAKELQIAAERKKLAVEQLNILKLQASRSENNAEMNDKLAEAEAAVTRADTEYYETTKRTQAAMAQLRIEIGSTTEAINEQTEAVENANRVSDEQIEKFAAKRREVLEKFGLVDGKTPEQKELDLLEKVYDEGLISYYEYQDAKNIIAEKYAKEREQITEQEVAKATALYESSVKKTTSSTAAALEAMSELLAEYADTSENAAKAQKAFALGAVLVNQAMAIAEGAKGIAAAQAGAAEAAAAGGPAAPALLAAYTAQMVGQVLATIASVASSIVEAKNILENNKYATGGVVGGNSYYGDRVTARVNSGEMILTQKQQAQLFDMANGRSAGAYEMSVAAMTAALQSMPAPVMVYREFEQFQQRTATYKEIASV